MNIEIELCITIYIAFTLKIFYTIIMIVMGMGEEETAYSKICPRYFYSFKLCYAIGYLIKTPVYLVFMINPFRLPKGSLKSRTVNSPQIVPLSIQNKNKATIAMAYIDMIRYDIRTVFIIMQCILCKPSL